VAVDRQIIADDGAAGHFLKKTSLRSKKPSLVWWCELAGQAVIWQLCLLSAKTTTLSGTARKRVLFWTDLFFAAE
jgi:hypothetical protein